MAAVLMLVSLVASLVSLVCWILTLIKMFQNEGVLQGILGIICGLYALILGFIRMRDWGHEMVMAAWTVAIVISIITNVIAAGMQASLQ
jgi:hypothetical protein